jgi:hypothetical protein
MGHADCRSTFHKEDAMRARQSLSRLAVLLFKATLTAGVLTAGCATHSHESTPWALAQQGTTQVFEAKLPAASGGPRVVLLILFPDNSCLFTEKFLARPPDAGFMSSGRWETPADNETILLHLVDERLKQRELCFKVRQDTLTYQGEEYGSVGLLLKRR